MSQVLGRVAFVVVLMSPGLCFAQTAPFVANHMVSEAAWIDETELPFDYKDLPGSEQTLVAVPAGTVLLTWSSTIMPDFYTRIRPRFGDSFPADGTVVRGGRSSGSWVTTTAGGSVTVALQVKSDFEGCCVGQTAQTDSLSWSILVFPETSNTAPAVSVWGLAVIALGMITAASIAIRRQRAMA